MAAPESAQVSATRPGPDGKAWLSSSLDLRSLALDIFKAIGALTEENGEGTVAVVVPDAYQACMGEQGFLRLAFDTHGTVPPDAQLVTIGSPLADQILALAGEFGRTTRWYVNGLRWARRQAIALDRWRGRFVNARFLMDGVELPFCCHYLLMTFRVSYISDERREELRTVVVDSGSLQPSLLLQRLWESPPSLAGDVLYFPDRLRPAGVSWPQPVFLASRPDFYISGMDQLPGWNDLELIYKRALTLLERQVADSIATYQRRTARLSDVERARVTAFYDDTEAELLRRMSRADSDDRRRALQAKLEACRLERGRKLADIVAKYRLRVVFKLLNAAVITQPKVRTRLKVENRHSSADLMVVFDPLTGEIELPTCASCYEATECVHLCANGHLACESCIHACDFCKREWCRDCGIESCVLCKRSVCPANMVRCDVCGRVTCPDHRGRCHLSSTTP